MPSKTQRGDPRQEESTEGADRVSARVEKVTGQANNKETSRAAHNTRASKTAHTHNSNTHKKR